MAIPERHNAKSDHEYHVDDTADDVPNHFDLLCGSFSSPSSNAQAHTHYLGPKVVIGIHGAAPGLFAHHLGVTPGGVICGHCDNSAIGRNLARGPSPRARTLIGTVGAGPRIKAAGVIGPLDLVAIGLLSAGEAEELHAMETSGAAKS
jgi:hypothetical protein